MEEFDGIVLREKEKRLSINRLPTQVKEEFIAFADAEFCEDYGMAFKNVWDSFKMWKLYFENLDMKLSIIIDKLNQSEQTPEESIKMMSGRKVKREVKK